MKPKGRYERGEEPQATGRMSRTRFHGVWPILLIAAVGLPWLLANARQGLAGEEAARDIHEILFRANQAYVEGRYDEAADGYETIVAMGHLNGHVFYNLGNALFRSDQLGRAILNYDKARLLLPRDGDLAANLQYARSQTLDSLGSRDRSFAQMVAFWYFGMNFWELLVTFIVLHILFWGVALLKLFRDLEWVKWAFYLSLLLSLVMGGSAALKFVESFRNDTGVILVEEAPVRSGFTLRDTVLFVLHEGAEFRIVGEEGDWWKITFGDGKNKGWLPARSAGRATLPLRGYSSSSGGMADTTVE